MPTVEIQMWWFLSYAADENCTMADRDARGEGTIHPIYNADVELGLISP